MTVCVNRLEANGRTWREPEDRRRPALGRDHGDGEDRAGGGGRQQPPDADRRRRRGAGAVPALVRRGGADARASTRWGRCSRRGRARTRRRCRSMSGAISTPSRPGASTTACWACSAALEVVRSMNDLGIRTRHPIVVTNWTNEEGARFAPAMLAIGRVRRGASTSTTPMRGPISTARRFGDELERIGWKGDEPVGRAEDARLFRAATSSRGRSSRPRARRSASSPTARGSGGSSSR